MIIYKKRLYCLVLSSAPWSAQAWTASSRNTRTQWGHGSALATSTPSRKTSLAGTSSTSSDKDYHSLTVPELKLLVREGGPLERGVLSSLKKKQDLIDFLNQRDAQHNLSVSTQQQPLQQVKSAVPNQEEEYTGDTHNNEDENEEDEKELVDEHCEEQEQEKELSSIELELWRLADAVQVHDAIQVLKDVYISDETTKLHLKTFHKILRACSVSRLPDCGFIADEILNTMRQFWENDRLEGEPNKATYNLAMNAWAMSKHPEAGEQVEQFLRGIPELTGQPPTSSAYTIATKAWARLGDPNRAQAIFREMLADYQRGNNRAKPTSKVFNHLINAWASSNLDEAAARCEMLLDQMEAMYKNGDEDVAPSEYNYRAAIMAWAAKGNTDKAEQIFQRMSNAFKNGNHCARPSVSVYTALMDAWEKSGSGRAGHRCQELLEELQAKVESGLVLNMPTGLVYTKVIRVWSKFGNPDMAEAAFDRMVQDHRAGKPDDFTYGSLIAGWSNSDSPRAGEMCLKLLQDMEYLYDIGDLNKTPNEFCYYHTINALKKCGRVEQATALFLKMFENTKVLLDARTFVNLMVGWAQSGSKNVGKECDSLLRQMEHAAKSDRLLGRLENAPFQHTIYAWAQEGNPKKAQEVYDRMLGYLAGRNPKFIADKRCFLALLIAWERSMSPDAGSKCEHVLDQMSALFQSGKLKEKPNTKCYTYTMRAFAYVGDVEKVEAIYNRMVQDYNEGNLEARPDSWTYNILMDVWVKHDVKDAAEKSQVVLDKMISMFDEGLLDCRPDTVSYTTVISAWAQKGDGQRARAVYNRMLQDFQAGNKRARPDGHSIGALMGALAKEGRPDAGFECEQLLAELEHKCPSEFKKRPGLIACSTVVSAWGAAGDPQRAENVFLKMLKIFGANNPDVRLDATFFGTLMEVWANSGFPGAAKRIEFWLDQMEAMPGDVHPDAWCYTNAIVAWIQESNLERARAIYNRMIKDYESGMAKPNLKCFNKIMNAYCNAGVPGVGQICQELLDQMESLHAAGTLPMKPDRNKYCSVLRAWATSQNGRKAEELLMRMLDDEHPSPRPNSLCFSIVMKALAMSCDPDAGVKCEGLLEIMKAMHRSGELDSPPDNTCYTYVVQAWGRLGDGPRAEAIFCKMLADFEGGNRSAKPNHVDYFALIGAWRRSKEVFAGEKIEALVNEMEGMYHAGGLEQQPDANAYKAAIRTYLRDGHIEAAEEFLQRAPEAIKAALPDVSSYLQTARLQRRQ